MALRGSGESHSTATYLYYDDDSQDDDDPRPGPPGEEGTTRPLG